MQLEDYFDVLRPDDIRLRGHRIGIETVLDPYLHHGTTKGYSPLCRLLLRPVDEEISGTAEVVDHRFPRRRGDRHRVHCLLHLLEPRVPLARADRKRQVTHPEAGMPPG